MSSPVLGVVTVAVLLVGACDRKETSSPRYPPDASAPARAPAEGRGSDAAAPNDAGRPSHALYVKIPLVLPPLERQERFGDPLDALLYRHGLGEVRSVKALRGGEPTAEAIGVDCRVSDAARAVPLLREKLRELGAPRGTLIEEERSSDTVAHPVW